MRKSECAKLKASSLMLHVLLMKYLSNIIVYTSHEKSQSKETMTQKERLIAERLMYENLRDKYFSN